MMKPTHARHAGRIALLGYLALVTVPGAALAQSAEQLAQADANGDGSVSKQELMDMRAATFARLDRNSDGYADSKDSPSFGPPKKKYEEALTKVKAADADGDGRISKAEMVDAPTPRFDAADKDGDGVLSSEEIAALRAMAS